MSNNAAQSIEKFAINLIKKKILNKRFKVYKYSSDVHFCDDGPYIVKDCSFAWSTKSEDCSERWGCTQVPIYELYISAEEIETGKSYYWKIDIRNLP